MTAAVPGSFRIRAESFAFTLTLGGRYAGEQEWVIQDRNALLVRVQTDFGGVLPEIRKVQHSRLHPRHLTSQGYTEGDGRNRPTFETTFDKRSGLMTLRQGRDEASAPLTTDYHDPVSLLLWLRTLNGQERSSVQLTGGRALIQHLPDIEIDGTPVFAYFLRPGNAYVYVEQEVPHRLIRLIQPTDFGAIEANIGTLRRGADRHKRRRL